MKRTLPLGTIAIIMIFLSNLPVAFADPGNTCLPEAVGLEVDGANNLYQVSDVLYRSAQPNSDGFKGLAALGIKTVVNLRKTNSDKDKLEDTSMTPVEIPMFAWDIDDEEVIEFLKITQNPEAAPILLHCRHGADRTGAMIAAYRVVVCNWSIDDAIEEMKYGGFGFHSIWWTLPGEVEDLNFDHIRQQVFSK